MPVEFCVMMPRAPISSYFHSVCVMECYYSLYWICFMTSLVHNASHWPTFSRSGVRQLCIVVMVITTMQHRIFLLKLCW